MKNSKNDYPQTPMPNCLYCFWFNSGAIACDNPKAMAIATFAPNQDRDCILLKYDKKETPEVPEKAFAQTYCLGKKCPYYFKSKKLCTRPTLCPYKGAEPNVHTTIKLKEDS